MKFNNELEIDVGRCLHAITRHKKFIALLAILGLLAGVAYTLDIGEDQYTAKATVYAAATGSYTESSAAVTAMNAYINVAKSYKVCQRAALLMGRSDVAAEDVMECVNAYTSIDTSKASISNFVANSATVITINATASDPTVAMEMANAVAEAYTLEMANIVGTDAIQPLDSAYTYEKTRNAFVHAWKLRALAMVAGMFVAMLVVIFFEIFDRKVRTIREGSIRGELPVIGVIPDYKE